MKSKVLYIVSLIISVIIVSGQLSTVNSVMAQTDVKLNPEVGARISVGLDKKIVKGLHVSVEEETRFDNNFRSFDRLQTTLAFKYKVHENVKLGLGYVFIAPYKSDDKAFNHFRHRLFFDITGTLKLGRWNLSLKERFQWTYRSGDVNLYQNPRNLLALKSRITVKYKSGKIATPYAYIEIRNVFNAPVISAYYNGSDYMTEDGYTTDVAGWFLTGYNGAYINRVRGSVGVELNLGKYSKLDFYFLADYIHNKVVDANAEGTKLKSYTKETGFVGNFGLSYIFAF